MITLILERRRFMVIILLIINALIHGSRSEDARKCDLDAWNTEMSSEGLFLGDLNDDQEDVKESVEDLMKRDIKVLSCVKLRRYEATLRDQDFEEDEEGEDGNPAAYKQVDTSHESDTDEEEHGQNQSHNSEDEPKDVTKDSNLNIKADRRDHASVNRESMDSNKAENKGNEVKQSPVIAETENTTNWILTACLHKRRKVTKRLCWLSCVFMLKCYADPSDLADVKNNLTSQYSRDEGTKGFKMESNKTNIVQSNDNDTLTSSQKNAQKIEHSPASQNQSQNSQAATSTVVKDKDSNMTVEKRENVHVNQDPVDSNKTDSKEKNVNQSFVTSETGNDSNCILTACSHKQEKVTKRLCWLSCLFMLKCYADPIDLAVVMKNLTSQHSPDKGTRGFKMESNTIDSVQSKENDMPNSSHKDTHKVVHSPVGKNQSNNAQPGSSNMIKDKDLNVTVEKREHANVKHGSMDSNKTETKENKVKQSFVNAEMGNDTNWILTSCLHNRKKVTERLCWLSCVFMLKSYADPIDLVVAKKNLTSQYSQDKGTQGFKIESNKTEIVKPKENDTSTSSREDTHKIEHSPVIQNQSHESQAEKNSMLTDKDLNITSEKREHANFNQESMDGKKAESKENEIKQSFVTGEIGKHSARRLLHFGNDTNWILTACLHKQKKVTKRLCWLSCVFMLKCYADPFDFAVVKNNSNSQDPRNKATEGFKIESTTIDIAQSKDSDMSKSSLKDINKVKHSNVSQNQSKNSQAETSSMIKDKDINVTAEKKEYAIVNQEPTDINKAESKENEVKQPFVNAEMGNATNWILTSCLHRQKKDTKHLCWLSCLFMLKCYSDPLDLAVLTKNLQRNKGTESFKKESNTVDIAQSKDSHMSKSSHKDTHKVQHSPANQNQSQHSQDETRSMVKDKGSNITVEKRANANVNQEPVDSNKTESKVTESFVTSETGKDLNWIFTVCLHKREKITKRLCWLSCVFMLKCYADPTDFTGLNKKLSSQYSRDIGTEGFKMDNNKIDIAQSKEIDVTMSSHVGTHTIEQSPVNQNQSQNSQAETNNMITDTDANIPAEKREQATVNQEPIDSNKTDSAENEVQPSFVTAEIGKQLVRKLLHSGNDMNWILTACLHKQKKVTKRRCWLSCVFMLKCYAYPSGLAVVKKNLTSQYSHDKGTERIKMESNKTNIVQSKENDVLKSSQEDTHKIEDSPATQNQSHKSQAETSNMITDKDSNFTVEKREHVNVNQEPIDDNKAESKGNEVNQSFVTAEAGNASNWILTACLHERRKVTKRMCWLSCVFMLKCYADPIDLVVVKKNLTSQYSRDNGTEGVKMESNTIDIAQSKENDMSKSSHEDTHKTDQSPVSQNQSRKSQAETSNMNKYKDVNINVENRKHINVKQAPVDSNKADSNGNEGKQSFVTAETGNYSNWILTACLDKHEKVTNRLCWLSYVFMLKCYADPSDRAVVKKNLTSLYSGDKGTDGLKIESNKIDTIQSKQNNMSKSSQLDTHKIEDSPVSLNQSQNSQAQTSDMIKDKDLNMTIEKREYAIVDQESVDGNKAESKGYEVEKSFVNAATGRDMNWIFTACLNNRKKVTKRLCWLSCVFMLKSYVAQIDLEKKSYEIDTAQSKDSDVSNSSHEGTPKIEDRPATQNQSHKSQDEASNMTADKDSNITADKIENENVNQKPKNSNKADGKENEVNQSFVTAESAKQSARSFLHFGIDTNWVLTACLHKQKKVTKRQCWLSCVFMLKCYADLIDFADVKKNVNSQYPRDKETENNEINIVQSNDSDMSISHKDSPKTEHSPISQNQSQNSQAGINEMIKDTDLNMTVKKREHVNINPESINGTKAESKGDEVMQSSVISETGKQSTRRLLYLENDRHWILTACLHSNRKKVTKRLCWLSCVLLLKCYTDSIDRAAVMKNLNSQYSRNKRTEGFKIESNTVDIVQSKDNLRKIGQNHLIRGYSKFQNKCMSFTEVIFSNVQYITPSIRIAPDAPEVNVQNTKSKKQKLTPEVDGKIGNTESHVLADGVQIPQVSQIDNPSNGKKMDDTEQHKKFLELEMKLLRLENKLLTEKVVKRDQVTTINRLENHILKLENDIMKINNKVTDIKHNGDKEKFSLQLYKLCVDQSYMRAVDSQKHVRRLVRQLDHQSKQMIRLNNRWKSARNTNQVLSRLVNQQSSKLSKLSTRFGNLQVKQRNQFDKLSYQMKRQSLTVHHPCSYAGKGTKPLTRNMAKNVKTITEKPTTNPSPIQHHKLPKQKANEIKKSGKRNNTNSRFTPLYYNPHYIGQKDCFDHFKLGRKTDTSMYIKPVGGTQEIKVFCDMSNGGWTVIQSRQDGTTDFYRDWQDYKQGFGTVNAEYWLGNANIHLLTNQGKYSLRIDMQDWERKMVYAEYDSFYIDKESEGFRLHVSGYRGNAGDGLLKHNGMKFSTRDVDNDLVRKNFGGSCAKRFKGAWWYYKCYQSNLNGVFYRNGETPPKAFDGISWKPWRKSSYSLKTVTMKIKPKL